MGHAPRRALAALVLTLSVLAAGCGTAHEGWAPAARLAGRAFPNLQIQFQERFYPVSGGNARALNRALARNGPRNQGRPAHALTEWHLDWSYRPVSTGAGCSARPAVSVEIVTTLPRWTDRDGAPDRLVSDWALFLARLRDHEAIHQHLALEGGRELLRRLEALVAADCTELERAAQQIVSSLESSHREEHRRFDLESAYGRRPMR